MKKQPSQVTTLTTTDRLPLTCTLEGTCCHGKAVWINPWELAVLAATRKVTAREFRDRFCKYGGIRLDFNGPPGWKDLPACSQYIPKQGCTVHTGRPLVCRLFPLGRERGGDTITYMHRGDELPCLEGCPGVKNLPYLTVAEYLAGQEVTAGERVQDAYLKLVEQLADGAFALLLESGLAASGDRKTLRLWRKLGTMDPEHLTHHIGSEWIDRLMLPDLTTDLDDPAEFVRCHHNILQTDAQNSFGFLETVTGLQNASGLMMALGLHLGRSLGINPSDLVLQWIADAKKLGAQE